MSKFSDFFAEADQPKFVSRMAGVMARNAADANRKSSVMSRPQGVTWKPEYEQEPALEAPMVSPDDLIGTGIPTKLAGLATMGAKAMAGHGAMGGLLGTFIGKGAKTWDALAAEKAKQLLEVGADPRKVWSETGTFKGVDGHLRQEIDDSAAKFTNSAVSDIRNANGKRQAQIFANENTYSAYPEAAQIWTVKSAGDKSGASAAYHPGVMGESDMISIGIPKRGTPDMNELRGSNLHELQHAIQHSEGWAQGGSPATFADTNRSLKNAMTRQDSQIEAMQRARDNGGIDPTSGFNMEMIRGNIKRISQQRQELMAADGAGMNPFEAYKLLAGEAEARATQTRMGMSMAERLQKFPYDSYDVPVDQLIVRGQR